MFETDEKIGKRKAAKLQAKAEKKAMREQVLETLTSFFHPISPISLCRS